MCILRDAVQTATVKQRIDEDQSELVLHHAQQLELCLSTLWITWWKNLVCGFPKSHSWQNWIRTTIWRVERSVNGPKKRLPPLPIFIRKFFLVMKLTIRAPQGVGPRIFTAVRYACHKRRLKSKSSRDSRKVLKQQQRQLLVKWVH